MPVATRAKPLQKKPVPEYSCPGVDERLVTPETSREEFVRGEKLVTMPANPPHAEQQQRLSYVIQGSTKPGYIGATDMLTRSSEYSDFAADTSIRKVGIDPQTGERYLEELAFEIVDAQSDADLQTRAEELSARGVRRIFAVFVRAARKEVCEWSAAEQAFKALGLKDAIDDPVFVKPVSVRAILDAAEADNEVIWALNEKQNPALAKLKEQAFEQGQRQAQTEALFMLVKAKFGPVSDATQKRILSAESAQLEKWMAKVLTAPTAEAVFA